LGEVAVVAQNLGHQSVEKARRGALADGCLGLGGEAETGKRRDDQIESVLRFAAMFRGVGEGVDHRPELVVRARPAVGDEQWALALRLAHDMDEVEVEVLHPRHILRVAVELSLCGAPVIALDPVGAEGLQVVGVTAVIPAAAVGGLRERIGGDAGEDVRHHRLVPLDFERGGGHQAAFRSGVNSTGSFRMAKTKLLGAMSTPPA
jgi:hypothetical protein